MNMPDVLENALAEMGFALVEQRGGDFFPVARLPGWFREICSADGNNSGPIPLIERSPFLENFLVEAEDFWNSPGPAECQSETWIEKSNTGREIPVQAKALSTGGKRILALFSPDAQFQ